MARSEGFDPRPSGGIQKAGATSLLAIAEALNARGIADRAGEIIDRIRDHIRKAPPRKARFDLDEAINGVIVLGRSAITKNEVLVQTRLAEGLFLVQGDCVQLQQVILNLVLNAVEAMGAVEARPQELLISTEQTEANGVLVAVRDSGPGIDPEHVARVFEAFYTMKSSGVGMGLAICRSIIDAHGGRLWAEAYEPRGAVFQFTLPGVESWVPAGRMAAIRPPPTSCGRSAGHDAELSKRQKSGSWAEDRLLPRACGPIA